MQPLIIAVALASGGEMGLIIGSVICAAVLAQVLLLVLGQLRRIVFEEQERSLARERLELLVKTAAAQWREAEQAQALWNGYRKFKVARKVRECGNVFSFHLQPYDGRPLPAYKPGQYLTFSLNIPGQDKPVVRCYSLSDCGRSDCYRVTIKKVAPPHDQPGGKPGLASSFFCDTVQESDILDVKSPTGNFYLDLEKPTPVVLISGGVGITPMLSMVNALVAAGDRREVWFIHGARNDTDHIQKEHLARLTREHPNIRLHVCYSRPTPEDCEGHDFQHRGHVTTELLKTLLPSNNYLFFICGPPTMMQDIQSGLKAWGVPDAAVRMEAFGPATVKQTIVRHVPGGAAAAALEVTFARTGKTARWNPLFVSVLELADKAGVKIESGCRAGNCGTCLVAVKSGEVEYLVEQGAVPEKGSCLTCICRPKTNLILDA